MADRFATIEKANDAFQHICQETNRFLAELIEKNAARGVPSGAVFKSVRAAMMSTEAVAAIAERMEKDPDRN